MKKPTKKIKALSIDLRQQQIICKRVAEAMQSVAVDMKLQISGQASVEGDGKQLIVLYSAYPNSDLIVWFLDQGYYSLMALVNQKFRHITSFSASDVDKFQEALTSLQNELGK